jgi:hypothetical protein
MNTSYHLGLRPSSFFISVVTVIFAHVCVFETMATVTLPAIVAITVTQIQSVLQSSEPSPSGPAVLPDFSSWLSDLVATSLPATLPGPAQPSLNTAPSSFTTSSTTTSLSKPALPTPAASAPITPERGLSSGVIAGISIGVLVGVLLIAVAAFLLGRRRSTAQSSTNDPVATIEPDVPIGGYKVELGGHGRTTVRLEGQGIARWWNKMFDRSARTRALNKAEPQNISVEEAKEADNVRQVWVRDEDLPEFRGV